MNFMKELKKTKKSKEKHEQTSKNILHLLEYLKTELNTMKELFFYEIKRVDAVEAEEILARRYSPQ